MKTLNESHLEEIINTQFRIANHDITYKDIAWDKWTIDGQEWFRKYTTTEKQEEEFKQFLMKYLKPFALKGRLEKEANRIILNYGLRRDDY